MKRSFKKVFKYILLIAFTATLTVVVFNLVRPRKYQRKAKWTKEEMSYLMESEKIDWHDYKAIKSDLSRQGRGEQGKPAYLKDNEMDTYNDLYKVNGFNAALSDKIAMNRSLPDIRNPGCKKKKYLKILGETSVIVPFHNEHWSTLIRTATSVINRSPPHLLKEVILVDDFSSKEFSKSKLDEYVEKHLPKVKVIHLPKRYGLIRARLAGAEIATGDILVFLDSHTECNVNWLPPLLEPIAQNYKTCVCPFIDVIQYETFEYRAQDNGARGAFDWEFYYKRLPLLPSDLEHPTEPFRSPVMAGGLFAISAKFFWELGGYDEGLDIWGGEQYELSFKIWMCGGQMYDAPCSRVGHIYRKYAPFKNPGVGDFVSRNYKRVAVVWMDEYAEYLYKRKTNLKSLDPGDVSKQLEIREKLKCKSFKWFMKNIAFDLPLKYPLVEPDDFGFGEIRNVAAHDLCIDTNFKGRHSIVGIRKCIKNTKLKGEQHFVLTWRKDIRPKGKSVCFDVSSVKEEAEISLFPCHGAKGNQYWKYDIENQWFVHGQNPRCIDCDPGRKKLFVTECNKESKTQQWRFENVNLTMIANWEDIGTQ